MSDTRPPVIVLHGALGAAGQMAPVVDALTSLGPARGLELPGHGATPAGDTPFTVDGFCDWLGDELSRTGGPPPLVFGYSMGGYVALLLASRRPGTISGIATLGTKFAWSPDVAAREASNLDPAVIRAKVPRFAEVLAARHAGAGGWESVLRSTGALLADLGGEPRLTPEALSAIRIPVVLAVGAADQMVSAEETRATAAMIAGAEALVLPDVPHPIEKVSPTAILDLVRALRAG